MLSCAVALARPARAATSRLPRLKVLLALAPCPSLRAPRSLSLPAQVTLVVRSACLLAVARPALAVR